MANRYLVAKRLCVGKYTALKILAPDGYRDLMTIERSEGVFCST